MLRRISIFGLAVGLAVLGPAPLSACAIWMQLPGECAPGTSAPAPQPKAANHCEEMNVPQASSDAQLSAPVDASCCVVKNVPLPASQSKQAAPVVSIDANRVAQMDMAPVPAPRATQIENNFEHSPPDLQPLLCVFLI
jgi:hypothetical protein